MLVEEEWRVEAEKLIRAVISSLNAISMPDSPGHITLRATIAALQRHLKKLDRQEG